MEAGSLLDQTLAADFQGCDAGRGGSLLPVRHVAAASSPGSGKWLNNNVGSPPESPEQKRLAGPGTWRSPVSVMDASLLSPMTEKNASA